MRAVQKQQTKNTKTKNSKLITSAILGLLSASAMASQTIPTGSGLPAEEKEGCKGKDGCKSEKKKGKNDGAIL